MQSAMLENALDPTPPSIPACDCHFHVFRGNEAAEGARYVPAYDATLTDWASAADGANVRRGVLVQPSFLGTDHRQLRAALAARPEQLRGVAVTRSDASGAETGVDLTAQLRLLHADGVRGIRLNRMGAIDDAAALRALSAAWWTALIEVGLHVELHADIGRVASLLPLVPREVTVVLDHFAKPASASARDETVRAVIHRARRHQRSPSSGETYVTLSGAYRQQAALVGRAGALARLWRDALGADRLLWGSDWPCTNFERAADYGALYEALGEWLPDENDRYAASALNAQRLYWR